MPTVMSDALSCHFTTLFTVVKALAKEHDLCTKDPIPLIGGPGIRSLPDHVSLFPLGRSLRLLCLRCGVRDHLSRRALFLSAHGCCSATPAPMQAAEG